MHIARAGRRPAAGAALERLRRIQHVAWSWTQDLLDLSRIETGENLVVFRPQRRLRVWCQRPAFPTVCTDCNCRILLAPHAFRGHVTVRVCVEARTERMRSHQQSVHRGLERVNSRHRRPVLKDVLQSLGRLLCPMHDPTQAVPVSARPGQRRVQSGHALVAGLPQRLASEFICSLRLVVGAHRLCVRRLEELRLAQTCSLSQLQPLWGLVRLVPVQRRFALHVRPVLAVEHPIPDRRIGQFIQRIGEHPVPDVPLALFHLHIRGEKHVCPIAAGGHLRGTALHARFVRRDLVQISVLLRVSPELEALAGIPFHVGDLRRAQRVHRRIAPVLLQR